MMPVRGVLGSFETSKNIKAILSNWGAKLIQVVLPYEIL